MNVHPNVPCAASSFTMRPRIAFESGCRAAFQVPRSSGIDSVSPTQKNRATRSAARTTGDHFGSASIASLSGSCTISVPPPSAIAMRAQSSTCTISSSGKREATATRSSGARHSMSARSVEQHAMPVRCSWNAAPVHALRASTRSRSS
ncbi:MAG: hypothetical protein IPJ34_12895 [Myxococcales bacterium]|nr:hypothetical protein [Myxococcales bacterium]